MASTPERRNFNRVVFVALTLVLFAAAFVGLCFSVDWLSKRPSGQGHRSAPWLMLELILVSMSLSWFLYLRPMPAYDFNWRETRDTKFSQRRFAIGWGLAWMSHLIPTLIQIYNSQSIGVAHIVLSITWLVSLWFEWSHQPVKEFSLSTLNSAVSFDKPNVYGVFRNLLTAAVAIQCIFSTIAINTVVVWIVAVVSTIYFLLAFLFRTITRPFDERSILSKGFVALFRIINWKWNWDELPTYFSLANLAAIREDLRRHNLLNTNASVYPVTNPAGVSSEFEAAQASPLCRHARGYGNDSHCPTMGVASYAPDGTSTVEFTKSHPDARFGRCMPIDRRDYDESRLLIPNPRTVSCELLARRGGGNAPQKKVASINLLSAAWIQFQVHGWFSHGNPIEENPIEVDIRDYPDPAKWPGDRMPIQRTRPDPTRSPHDADSHRIRTFVNSETHWWDGSQLYGSSPWITQELQSSQCPFMPSIHPDPSTLPAVPGQPIEANTGFKENWWIGLAILHELFVLEHNAICNALRSAYPQWPEPLIFEKARLINAALMAKIHTVEWTPAILANPVLEIAMDANWWGLFTERAVNAFGRLGLNEAFWGIPNSAVNHHTAPYALPEEFVAVYRMHSLIPDEIVMRRMDDPSYQKPIPMLRGFGTVGAQSELTLWSQYSQEDLFYSLGTDLPGELTLNNYPNALRHFQSKAGGPFMDLATIDIVRDRERQIPRYNRFRESLRMKPIQSFNEFNTTDDKSIGERLRKVYGTNPDGSDNVDDLDLLVGTLAESKPDGFGFSDTSFRIFILLASRRLKSDRFTAQDFTSEVYTQLGLDWVNQTSMKDVLARHHPRLSRPMKSLGNAFKPWEVLS